MTGSFTMFLSFWALPVTDVLVLTRSGCPTEDAQKGTHLWGLLKSQPGSEENIFSFPPGATNHAQAQEMNTYLLRLQGKKLNSDPQRDLWYENVSLFPTQTKANWLLQSVWFRSACQALQVLLSPEEGQIPQKWRYVPCKCAYWHLTVWSLMILGHYITYCHFRCFSSSYHSTYSFPRAISKTIFMIYPKE